MKNLSDIVGMFAFPFQTEIAFVAAIYPTAKNLTVSTRGTSVRSNTGAHGSASCFLWFTWDLLLR
uniref:Uncharacterized protein n=1 Tax=Escherichia coli TaxID=562 RepID=A0A343J1D4_ECOLX|nr:hypothetical protein ECSA44_05886 [Escherichia coli]